MPRVVIAVHIHQNIPNDWLQELLNRYTKAVTDADVVPYGNYHVDHIESGIVEGEEITHASLKRISPGATAIRNNNSNITE